ncbi:hypothetical protein [Burkholderia cenocepacia]|uniref:hypothetical protein n=1 Tax=Burkholderia cenocepacia TaxID=95486 RepID=UPI00158927C2|nr:hypothetical protein [Burkholderia cenocepacia]
MRVLAFVNAVKTYSDDACEGRKIHTDFYRAGRSVKLVRQSPTNPKLGARTGSEIQSISKLTMPTSVLTSEV